MDLLSFINRFHSDKICEKYLIQDRFSNGIYCIYCKHQEIYTLNTKTKYTTFKCSSCKERFSILTRTIFERTHIPLQKWFIAIYLLTGAKKGMSSVELAQKLKVTQKTAWVLSHRIRECFTMCTSLQGIVEMDETFIGGKEKNKHENKRLKQGRGTVGKVAVMGAVSREEKKAIAYPVSTVNADVVVGCFIKGNVSQDSVVFADECTAYDTHTVLRVNHSKRQYADGMIHTNSIESFGATIKRGYIGIYHWWSKKHLGRYIDEFVFRFNYGEGSAIDYVLHSVVGKRLSYKNAY